MPLEQATRRLAAILSADVVGYSRLMAEDREATVALVRECRETVAGVVARHAGRVVDAVGDNVLAEFQTATAATGCAVALQQELSERAARGPGLAPRLQLRIGIDLGEILAEEGRIYGDGVNVAARLQALAEPGEIYVSGPVREQIRGTLKLRCDDLGEHAVKNIPYAVRVHRVVGEAERGAAARREARSLAVLPFADLGGSASSEAFADGLAEEILNLLARLGELKLAARTSCFYFKNRNADIREIARRLGVKHVLEGSVRRDGARIRVTAQLIDGESGFHVWSETYDRELRGVFAIQDEISRHVVRELKGVLSRELEGRLASARPTSLEAYECVLQGRAYMHRPSDLATLETAVRLFTRAIELDPRYAPAHAGLCRAELARFHASRSGDAFERARAAGERAIELEPASAEARIALGALYLHSGRLDEALAALELAVAIDPFSADARQTLAEVYARQNRSDDAIRAFHEAIDLQPGNWIAHQVLGGFLFSLGRFKEAEQEFQRVIDLTPDNAAAHANLGSVLYMAGDFERAAACWHAALQLSPSALTCTNLGSLYCLLGRFEEAAEVLERAVALAPEDHRPHGVLADALRQLPGRDSDARRLNAEAMRLAERALSIDPSDAETLGLLGHYCAEAGDGSRARALCARSLALAPLDTQRHYDAARIHARLGALEEAQGAIERAVELGYPPKLAARDVALAPLAGSARFQRWMQG